jgi:pre-rRNA-processing protein TSR1
MKLQQSQRLSLFSGKELLMFHCGFRRFPARPIYSDDSRQPGKHMTERFFQLGRFSTATVYAPISFPPAPLLAFKPSQPDELVQQLPLPSVCL